MIKYFINTSGRFILSVPVDLKQSWSLSYHLWYEYHTVSIFSESKSLPNTYNKLQTSLKGKKNVNMVPKIFWGLSHACFQIDSFMIYEGEMKVN